MSVTATERSAIGFPQ
ncbi:MAG: hypothetical protein LBK83_08215 [Treponema sp.]|nr:hypothetical protein [Treponema sp.]